MTSPQPDTDVSGQRAYRVMIAEDEFLIALMIEQDLRNAGYRIAGPFAKVADAFAAASAEEIDAAILDVNMNGEMSFPVADKLAARGVPFIFLSGYGQGAL